MKWRNIAPEVFVPVRYDFGSIKLCDSSRNNTDAKMGAGGVDSEKRRSSVDEALEWFVSQGSIGVRSIPTCIELMVEAGLIEAGFESVVWMAISLYAQLACLL